MPWSGRSFASRHNHALRRSPRKAARAARQANAILKKTGDERLAISVANKDAKKSARRRSRGLINRS